MTEGSKIGAGLSYPMLDSEYAGSENRRMHWPRLGALFLLPGCVTAIASTAANRADLPLAFECRGTGADAHYVGHGKAYTVDLSRNSARVFVSRNGHAADVISLEFKGSSRPPAQPDQELPGKVNYFIGQDPRQWQIGLPTFRRVVYTDAYPGIDIAYYGANRRLEFDLIVRPGADPRQIRLKLRGARRPRIEAKGTLVLDTPSGDLRLELPAIYQDSGGKRREIPGRYVLSGKDEIGFRVNAYDRTKRLIIDPALVFATLLGGNSESYGTAVAVDALGNSYVTGFTAATDFPIVNGLQAQIQGYANFAGFVTKIDPTGTNLVYSTYIGGSSGTNLFGIAVDSAGAAWVTGFTLSTDFPVMNAYQPMPVLNADSNGVVVKLSATGALEYSTFFGVAEGYAIAVDLMGSAYVTGAVSQGDAVATSPGAYLTVPQGGADAFAAKFDTNGALLYSTYLGGSGDEYAYAIAVDSSGNAFITGSTASIGFTNAPAGGAQTTTRGRSDCFIAKLNPYGTALGYFTFLGGSADDQCNGIAVDGNGNAFVAGTTNSIDFPVSKSALQTLYGGGTQDGFVAKLNATGSAFAYVTYVGGTRRDSANAIALDDGGNAYVTGQTQSDNFPAVEAIQPSLPDNLSSTSLFRTIDLGASWTPFDANVGGIVYDILPDPKKAGVILVLTDSGVYRTTDAGATWRQTLILNTSMFYAYATVLWGSASRSLADSNTVYVLAGGFAYRSADGGLTWSSGSAVGVVVAGTPILADPLNIGTAYIAVTIYTILKTTDGGVTWSTLNTGITSMTALLPTSFEASADGSLYMDGEPTIYKSTDQGNTWTSVPSSPINMSPTIAISPANASIVLRADSQPFNTPNPPAVALSTDGGATWSPASNGLGYASPSRILFDPLNPNTAYLVSIPMSAVSFVTAIDSTGTSLIYSTYLSGIGAFAAPGNREGTGIALYRGDVIVAGTSSPDFPGTTGLYASLTPPQDAFVARITGTTPPCSYVVNPSSQVVGITQIIFTVLAPSGCVWTASSDQTWATIETGASGSGSGMVTILLTGPQTSQTQTATLTIAGQKATLTFPGWVCSYSLPSGTDYQVSVDGGPVTIPITAADGCPWNVVNQYPFSLAVLSGGSGTGSANILLRVSPFQAGQQRTFTVPIADNTVQISQSDASPCDIGSGGPAGIPDLQSILKEALGIGPATHDLNQDGTVTVADIQLVANAALILGCGAQ